MSELNQDDSGSSSSDGNDSSSAGTQNAGGGQANGDAGGGTGGGNPKTEARIQKLIAQRNESRDENTRLKATIVQMTGAGGDSEGGKPVALGPLADPPVEVTDPRERMDFYLEQGMKRYGPAMIQEVFGGLDLKALPQVLKATQEHVTTGVLQRYRKACSDAGLDPENEAVKHVVAGYMSKTDKSPEEAIEALMSISGPAAETPTPFSGADALLESLSGVTAVTDQLPKTDAEAVQMARDGKAVRHMDTAEILTKSREEDRKSS